MKTVSATVASQDLLNIIDQIITNSEPIQITSEKGDVVMLSAADWFVMQGTLNANFLYGLLADSEKKDITKNQIRDERIKEKYGDID